MKRKNHIVLGIMLLLFVAFTTVMPANSINAAGKISISQTKLKLKKGVSYQLKLNGTTAKPVWKSTKPKVAKVSSTGMVKAKKAGKTVIYAKLGKKKYKCSLQVYSGTFKHKHKYKEHAKIQTQYLILDPPIMPELGFSVGLVSGKCYDIGDVPEVIGLDAGTGYGNGYFRVYDGIVREGTLVDDTHFKLKKKNCYMNRGNLSLVTKETDVIDLEKLEWYCVHDQVGVEYRCVYCDKLKNNAIYNRGGEIDVTVDTMRDKHFTKYVHSRYKNKCTCRKFVRKQYGCWWLHVDMAPEEMERGKMMKVTSKLIKEGVMVHYETRPIKVKYSRCKHQGELVYCGSTYGYGPKDVVIGDEEHNRYTCMDCGAIIYKKDLSFK